MENEISNRAFSVSVRGLTRLFGTFVAVDRIDLVVRKGEIFGFLGPNGAGKSTTIKMLCGLLLPTSGTGTVGGYDIVTASEDIKKNIGYMSQKFSLYDDLTVEENITFFSGIYSVPENKRKTRRDWVLSMSDLKDRKNALTGRLPGGFKQRLALGCAMLHEPPILFLDEPTSGVDPLSRRNFWTMIYEMARSGTTVFVTTHYMDEADYCDRLALIYRGRIIAEGTPSELRVRLMKRDVLEIEVDQLVRSLEILNANAIDSSIFGSVLHATVHDHASAGPAIREMLRTEGVKVIRIEKIVPSLEDVFVTMIETA